MLDPKPLVIHGLTFQKAFKHIIAKIGVYCGGVGMCFLAESEQIFGSFEEYDPKRWHQLPLSLSKIENTESLIVDPVDDLVICADHYAVPIFKSSPDKNILNENVNVQFLAEL